MEKAISKANLIAITTGEPAGIGPDICLQLAQQYLAFDEKSKVSETSFFKTAIPVFIADPSLLAQRAQELGLNFPIKIFNPLTLNEKAMWVIPIELKAPVESGLLNSKNSPYVLATLDRAIDGCLQHEFQAMVTAPVQKSIINEAGISFSGHTEYLAEKCQQAEVVMMLATSKLRVALATTHLPLSAVPKAITKPYLQTIVEILHEDLLTKFGIRNPEILVCGLNPHAGENGHLGREEIEVIEPVIESLREAGMNLIGPLPADTLFTEKYLKTADAVLAMYHDQGLPVLKSQGFGEAVNVTLGLPIIRTSVDHGTALDLAGTGKASMSSLMAAFTMAAKMSNSQT